MGYVFSIVESKFKIPHSKVKDAALAVASLPGSLFKSSAGNIEHAATAYRLALTVDIDNNVTGIEQFGEKLRDQTKFLEAVAPYVVAGSFIQCRGEDGGHWRWEFDGSKFTEKQAKIVYE